MRYSSAIAVGAVMLAGVGTSRADFKYSEQSKVTGGTLANVTKKLSVFSKSAREATAPQTTTTMVRGNKLRTENSMGTAEIIDLDGKRFIHIDNNKKTYTVETFEQLKQQIAQAQAKATQEQTHAATKQDDKSNVTMVPKFETHATGATHDVLDLPAKEVNMRVDLKFQSTDPKTEADLEKSNMSTWLVSNSWYGTVPGYEELRAFYLKMAKEMNFTPESFGMASPQMGQAMSEFKKNAVKMDGMPLIQYTSFGMSGQGQDSSTDAQQAPPPETKSSTPTNPSDAIAKGIGGLFAKKKKKQEEADNAAAQANTNVPPPPPPVPGSLMDMTMQVTSYSKDSLDASLFDIPAGYTQVQQNNNSK